MPFILHPGIGAVVQKMAAMPPLAPLAVGDVDGRRARVSGVSAVADARTSTTTGVKTEDFYCEANDGHQILLRWYTKTGTKPPGSAVIYLHGGGYILGDINGFGPMVSAYVSRTGVPFLSVEYRLAPEFQAPTQVTDAYAGLKYLADNAAALGVDRKRIAIMGDSAGGGIVASLAHYLKQQGGPAVAKQILVYPMLDDRTVDVNKHLAYNVLWSADDNQTGWGALLGKDRKGGADVKPIEAAGRATLQNVEGLPPVYMDVGQLDLFADEGLAYARLLGKAGVECEFHLIPQVNHGFEHLIPGEEVTAHAMSLRARAIASI